MANEVAKRRKAYEYILSQANKLPPDNSKILSADVSTGGHISLEDLLQLKEGLSNSSETLIKQLKELFINVISEDDISCHLIKPFSPENT
ncbi:hypothetical protein ACFLW3_01670 [Chloroflexota bacterium]